MQPQFTHLATWALLLFLTIYPASATLAAGVMDRAEALRAAHPTGMSQQIPQDCEHIGAMLEDQKQFLSGEIGRVRREMAILRQELSTPGIREIVAGIGYVFGLTGIAFYLKSRKGSQRQ